MKPIAGRRRRRDNYTNGQRVEYDFAMTAVPMLTMLRVSAALAAICAVVVWILGAAPQEIGPRDALWIIVHDECVPDQLHSRDPTPCVQVDLHDGIEKGFAILKDIRGATQFLLIPTARVSGIESPIILAPDAPNYFADAWEARTYIDEALHRTLPRDDIGLAINSAASRSQDQLHIHVDCIRPDLQEALREHEASIENRWEPLDVPFSGHHYVAMWVPGERLGSNNPFRLLAEGFPGAAQDMGSRTLVVVGSSRANGAAGFVILEDQVNRESHDSANGEELLDHACRIVTGTQPKN
ncbi:MAG: CDP-diacylglycerol diphosphatase [Candidatus Acidiferrales bacterium]